MVRRTRLDRCEGCGVVVPRCVCAGLEKCELPFPLVVVQHGKERSKPTNTVRLLARVVADCRVVRFALQERPWAAELLGAPDPRRWLLFPGPHARTLDRASVAELAAQRAPLVVVDGSWRQAGRMVRRGAGLAELPSYSLPPGAPSRWSVRHAPRVEQLCTFESMVRLAQLLDDPRPAQALDAAFARLIAAQVNAPTPLA